MYQLNMDQIRRVVHRGARALYEYCRENGIHFLVVGSSGGLDSAATLGFMQRACEMAKADDYILVSVGITMPINSKPDAERLGREAIERFAAIDMSNDLTGVFDYIDENKLVELAEKVLKIRTDAGLAPTKEQWAWDQLIAQGNIKARLRMMLGTYHIARLLGSGMVMSTDNLSEFWMAFWTLHGDVGDYGIIQQILKGLELYDIARYLGVPQEIINARPDDGLAIAGGDEDQLGASYPVIDQILISLIQRGFDPDGAQTQLDRLPTIPGFNQALVESLARRTLNGSFKRQGGGVVLTREFLGLPDIMDIDLAA
jgi:NAD+ synthase